MAQKILLKRSNTTGNYPTNTQIDIGELAINTYDGSMFMKLNDGSNSVIALHHNQALHYDTSNDRVGIGTTSPSELLHVYGNLRVGTTSQGRIKFADSDDTEILGQDQTHGSGACMTFKVNDANRMHINNAGRVGIGTTSPEKNLHVKDSANQIRIEDSTNNKKYDLNVDGNAFMIDDMTAGVNRFAIANGGNIGIGTTSPGTLLHLSNASDPTVRVQDSSSGMVVGLQANDSVGFVGTTTNSDFAIRTNNTARLHIENSGNVGINDTVPSKGKLQINQQSNTLSAIQLTNSSQTSSNHATYPISIFFGDEQVGSSARHQASINAVREAWSNSPAALTFKTSATVNGATEKMRITSAGNVGIGTTNPTGRLHVYDSGTDTYGTQPIAIFDYYDTDDTALRYSARIGDGATTFKTFVTSSATDFLIQDQDNQAGRLAFQVTGNAGSNQILAAESTGKVGIGTITPSYPLEVAGNVSINTNSGNKGLRIITAADSEAYVIFGDSSDNSMGSIVYNNASNYLSISANNAERMRINSSGNVGIGKTNPQAKLDVAGQGSGPSAYDYDYAASDGGIRVHGEEAAIDIVGSDANNHASSLLLRNANEGFGFINNSSANTLELKSFNPSADGFRIHSTGHNVSNLVTILSIAKAGAITFNNAYTFPTSDGSANQVLQTDGSGNLSFATVSGGGGITVSNNANNRVLTGDGTNANAEANLTFDGSTLALTGDMTITDTSTDPFLKLATSEREYVVRIDNSDADKFQIRDVTGTATRFSISTGGNVGIGETSPSQKLHVAGNIYAASGFVNSSGYQLNGTYIVDSSRNLVNIGTASFGDKVTISTATDEMLTLSASDDGPVYMSFERGTDRHAYFGFGSSGDVFTLMNEESAGTIRLGTAGTVALTLDASQNATFAGTISSGSITSSGNIDVNSDAGQLQFGADNDMQIFHNGAGGEINNATGDFTIDSVGDIILDGDGADIILKDGGTEFGRFTQLIGGLAIGAGSPGGSYPMLLSSTKVLVFTDMQLGDDEKIIIGDGATGNLQIYHDGTNSYLDDVAEGDLILRTNGTNVKMMAGSETMVNAAKDGAVTLYYDSSAKLATKSDGVDITGELQSDSLDVDGAADISGNLTIGGNLTVNGSTVTNSATNTTIEDALIELGSGNTGANANDLGLILERGTTGDNVFIGWDESIDKVRFATTTATGASTGALTLTDANIQAGTVSGTTANFTTSLDASLTVQSTDSTTGIVFTDPNGTGHIYYIGSQDRFYTDGKFGVNGSTIASGMEFQVNGDSKLTGTLDVGDQVTVQSSTSTPLSSLFAGSLVVKGSGSEDPIIAVTDSATANAAAGVFHQSSTNPGFPALVINAASNGSEQPLISARTNVSNTTGVGGTEVFAVDGDGDATFAGSITVSGTVDGVDIAARNAVLTSTTTTANAALPKAGGTMTGNLTIGSTTDSTKIVFPDKNVADDPTAAGDDRQLIGMGNSGAGGLFQTTGRGGLMLASADDSVIIASGDVGRNYDPDAGGYHPDPNNEEIYLLTDGGVRFMTNLQTSASYKQFIFDNSGNATIPGNITVSGTVDGRDVATDGSKLDGIEANATADQTASEILTAIKTVDGSGSGLDADTLDGKEGSDLFNFGYAYKSNNISRAVGSGAQWYKVASFSGGVKHITMKVHSSGDNTTGADSFFISAGSYGMKAQIVRMPSTKYNGTKLEEVRTKFVSGASYEIWIKVASITSSVGYLQVFMNDSGVTTSLSAGSEPSVGTADATLPITAQDRIDYSLQATNKIEAMGGFVVDGSTVWHAGNDGSGSGLDADTLDGVQASSFLRSDATDTASGDLTFTGFCTFDNDGSPSVKISGDDFGEQLELHRNHSANAPSIKFTNNGGQIGILYAADTENELKWRDGSTTNNHLIFHAGNSAQFTSALNTKLSGIETGATADQTQSDINALGITQVGTITSGTWNGSVIASAYLDSDTAHLSGTQTFTGAKTFNAGINLNNSNIGAVNNLSFNDPGPNEGLSWSGGNIKIYESPNDLTTNTAGNLQIVYGSTRRFTVSNTGVDVNGALTATTKSFDIEHPSKDGMRLRYGSLEGPENGVYVRGKSQEKVILLPDYWVDLVHEDSITVQLTAIGGGQELYVEKIEDNKVYVNGENYFYYIQAERKDVERFEVEYGNSI